MEINDTKTDMNQEETKAKSPKNVAKAKKPWWRKALKVTAWVIMAVVLYTYGLLVGTVGILTPERLTPLVTKVANKSLNADVSIGRVELSLKNSFPFLTASVDDLTIVSRDTKKLDQDSREMYPEWIDTLANIKKFSGGINIFALAGNTLDLSDVRIERPAINLAYIDDETSNYDIFPASEDTTAFNFADVPNIKMKRFEVVDPQPVRYYDGESDATLVATFTALNLDGNNSPRYTLNINTDVTHPVFDYFSLDKLVLGLNGDIEWNQQSPYAVALNNFKFELAFLKGVISTSVDFNDDLLLNALDLKLDPISVAEVLNMVPDEMAEEYGIPKDIDTGADICLDFKLSKPYNLTKDAIPCGVVNMKIPETYLSWQNLKLEKVMADITATTPDDNIDHATVKINALKASGPATDIEVVGTVTNLLSDPTFDGDIDGSTDLSRLPPMLKQLVGGSLSGRLTACIKVAGRQSMFAPTKFQQLAVTGSVIVNNLRWQTHDTANSLYVGRASFNLGTNESYSDATRSVKGLMTAKIKIDTAAYKQDDVVMNMSDISLGLGTRNSGPRIDTTQVVPIGGKVHVGRFVMHSDVDSSNFKLREVDGSMSIRAHNGDMKTPELNFDLGIRRVSTGDNTTRVSLSRSTAQFTAVKQPASERRRTLKKTADSLKRVYPKLSSDSINSMARALTRSSRTKSGSGSKSHHVHSDGDEDHDVIDWGMTGEIKQILNDWTFSGSITAGKASLFTPYFPLRNRLKDVDLSFNNDSVKVKNVKYTVGRSDFEISGEITNIRRALTSRSGHTPLKVMMSLKSDTIDVNQLAETTFKGSAYAEKLGAIDLSNIESDEQLDSIISAVAKPAETEATAFLVPLNIEATLRARSKNIIYSDLLLHDFRGDVLAYQGALNLHRLRAGSDVGQLNMSALYMGAKRDSLSFSFALQVDSFNIKRFTKLVPAVDTLMPMLDNFSGIISADIAASTNLYNNMDFDMSSLEAAIKLTGDSLVLIDPDTFKSLSKWLLFKNKNRNIIDHMAVEMIVKDNMLNIYPFIFDIDRYKLGIQGYNDLAMNFNYHIAVFKSPIPFKFGINVSGNPDKFKVRLGGAKFKENTQFQVAMVDNTRVNLLGQIESVFRRGIQNSRPLRLNVKRDSLNMGGDEKLSHADSLNFIREGLIEKPDSATTTEQQTTDKKQRRSSKSKKDKETAALVRSVTESLSRFLADDPRSRRQGGMKA